MGRSESLQSGDPTGQLSYTVSPLLWGPVSLRGHTTPVLRLSGQDLGVRDVKTPEVFRCGTHTHRRKGVPSGRLLHWDLTDTVVL